MRHIDRYRTVYQSVTGFNRSFRANLISTHRGLAASAVAVDDEDDVCMTSEAIAHCLQDRLVACVDLRVVYNDQLVATGRRLLLPSLFFTRMLSLELGKTAEISIRFLPGSAFLLRHQEKWCSFIS